MNYLVSFSRPHQGGALGLVDSRGVELSLDTMADLSPAGATLLRNEPVQARSAARLEALLDSAAAVVEEIGYERLTTAMVAERAGASIGTVYRYFPDRIVVLQGLSQRFVEQFTAKISLTVFDSERETWRDAVSAWIDDIIAAFREEPGFRSLRFGDVLDIAAVPGSVSGTAVVAEVMATALGSRFGIEGDDVAFHLEVALSLSDALLARAFTSRGTVDERFIVEAKAVATTYLAGVYGSPSPAPA